MATGLVGAGWTVYCANLRAGPEPHWLQSLSGASHLSLDADALRHYPAAIVRLARFLRRERIDVLQSHLFDGGVVGVLAARLARTPLVIVTRHHTDQVLLVGTKLHVQLDRWMARAADGVVAVSNAVRDHLVSKDGVDATPIEVIYLGFDFDRLQEEAAEGERVRCELALSDGFVIGCVAQLYETKGQSYLITALAELIDRIPDAKLLIVGGTDRTRLEAQARKLGVFDRVVFAGHRRDVPACLRAMNVVVHPSLSEAFSQVVIEAMASGTPLVSTDVGGAREVIEDGETGLLVPPADVAAIVTAVLRLHGDGRLRMRLSQAGRLSVTSRFTVDRMVERQLDCYRRWLDRARAS
jgi:glycosyltransferase involved in cell wall biosynthesis